MTTETVSFPVTWDNPADAEKTWFYNPEHMPLPYTPLVFDLVLAPFLRGFGWGMNPLQMNFYTFFAFDGPRDANEPPVADIPYLEMAKARWANEILPEVTGYVERYRTHDFDALTDEELVNEIERLREVRYRSGQLHTQSIQPHWLGHQLLIDTHKKLIGDDELAALKLAQGYGNKSVEAGERLWEVMQTAKSVPSVQDRLLATEPSAALDCFEQIERDPEARPFVEAFRAYLDEFGWRTGNDATGVTWIEDPTVPLNMLQTYLKLNYDPAAEQRALVDERESAIAAAMAKLDAEGQAQLRAVIDGAAGVATLSEDHNFHIDQRLTTTPRRLLLAAGRRLVSKGSLRDADLVFFLRAEELTNALRHGGDSQQEACEHRKAELARWRDIRPPRYVGATPPDEQRREQPRPPVESDNPAELRGFAASAGVARGPVRVLTNLSQAERLRPGDVLVVPVTSPPWTPLFAIACAIVTEVGGALSHTAVVAREYAIPAVVNVRNATKRLHDGELVEVDGSAGIVRVLN